MGIAEPGLAVELADAQDGGVAVNVKHKISWSEVYGFCDRMTPGRVYGVPRGGLVLLGIAHSRNPAIVPVDDPNEADYILDDIVDSGATKKRYGHLGIPFVAMVDKVADYYVANSWVEFPWEDVDTLRDNCSIVERLLELIGEDPTREGLRDTPKRFLKAMLEMTSGTKHDPAQYLGTTFGSEGYDEIVVVKNIEFSSLCEHHMLPFAGHVHFAYLPDERIVGLSKIPRLVEVLSRRLQVQERLTKSIADVFQKALQPRGIAVVVQGKHSCMSHRGVGCREGSMGTSVMRGVFKENAAARAEALMLMGIR
jgi:GTP cyclohydrolase I